MSDPRDQDRNVAEPSASAPAPGANASAEYPTAPAPAPEASPSLPLGAPSNDVTVAASAALPGEHRGGFQRELTAPVPITATVHTEFAWAETPAPAPAPTHLGSWALTFAVVGLAVSFLVGWGFLIGLVGLVLAILALRRPWESRSIAVWALCLSGLSLVYSAGWLWWASTQGPLFG